VNTERKQNNFYTYYNLNFLRGTIRLLRILTMLSYLLLTAISIQAQETSLVSGKPSEEAFSLTNCIIYYDETDFAAVKKTAGMFAGDIEAKDY
jgi:hypothetical protein